MSGSIENVSPVFPEKTGDTLDAATVQYPTVQNSTIHHKRENGSAFLNEERRVRGIVFDACGRFLRLRDGVVTFRDTLTRDIFRMPVEKVTLSSVRNVLETNRAKKDLTFKLMVHVTDAIEFITRLHNIPRGVCRNAAEAAVAVIVKHLRRERDE